MKEPVVNQRLALGVCNPHPPTLQQPVGVGSPNPSKPAPPLPPRQSPPWTSTWMAPDGCPGPLRVCPLCSYLRKRLKPLRLQYQNQITALCTNMRYVWRPWGIGGAPSRIANPPPPPAPPQPQHSPTRDDGVSEGPGRTLARGVREWGVCDIPHGTGRACVCVAGGGGG